MFLFNFCSTMISDLLSCSTLISLFVWFSKSDENRWDLVLKTRDSTGFWIHKHKLCLTIIILSSIQKCFCNRYFNKINHWALSKFLKKILTLFSIVAQNRLSSKTPWQKCVVVFISFIDTALVTVLLTLKGRRTVQFPGN